KYSSLARMSSAWMSANSWASWPSETGRRYCRKKRRLLHSLAAKCRPLLTTSPHRLTITPEPCMTHSAWLARAISWRTPLAIAAGALVGCGLMFAASARFGIGVTPDSIEYCAVAQSLADGQGLQGSNGTPYVTWPPLYPLLLSIGPRCGFSVLSFA